MLWCGIVRIWMCDGCGGVRTARLVYKQELCVVVLVYEGSEDVAADGEASNGLFLVLLVVPRDRGFLEEYDRIAALPKIKIDRCAEETRRAAVILSYHYNWCLITGI